MTKIDSINECSENGANINGVTMHVKNHKELVSIIKGVHLKLREAFHLTRDIDKVWKAHIADEELRKIYSIAMFKLATEIWETKESRISWSYNTCVDYFKNGGIERSLLRELKIQQKWSPAQTEELKHLIFLSNEKNNYKGINRKLKLLDVGSCYNPFSKFSMFSCVAIDLTPAVEDVKQCDFLSVEVSSQENSKIDGHYITTLCEESFDIVVFSLVLEYLPATNQRMEFCTKAWKLLQRNGLLIIITPDSKRLQHNVAMMKSWKKALEKIGFIRIKYDKLTHLHCMAFRKLYKSLCNENPNEDVSDLLYIPQDFKQYSATIQSLERTEYENYILHQQFSELPN